VLALLASSLARIRRFRSVKQVTDSSSFIRGRESLKMVIAELIMAGIFWYLLQNIPGLLQSVGYLFGLLLACWTFDEYF
jgi:hypothetical protein